MACLQVFAQRIERQRRRNPLTQHVGQKFDGREIADGFKIAHILPEEPVKTLFPPAALCARGLSQEGLRKSAKLHKRRERFLRFPGRNGQFLLRSKGMRI